MISYDWRSLFESLGCRHTEDCEDFTECFQAWRPHLRPRALAWAVNNVVNDQGRPYDHAAYPHLGAPGGPLDALDDPRVRTIALQFATRLGKSFLGQVCLLYHADCDPCPMLLASESERSLKRIMMRNYEMIYGRRRLELQLLHPSRRDHKQDTILFRNCWIRGGWARSAGTIADMNIKVGFANELDKDGWDSRTTTKEGAPEKLYDDRFKDYWSVRKVIYESTPTVRGRSRIERRRLLGTNCSYWVPCPHCGAYQVLRMGHEVGIGRYEWDEPGRLEWDLREGDVHDRDLARKTARYICSANECVILDEHRAWMMRRGVWAPEGCQIDDAKASAAIDKWQSDLESQSDPVWHSWRRAEWVTGVPVRDDCDASYQLSSLYALALGWGDIAAEWCDSRANPQIMRNFVNQWAGQTWEAAQRKTTWEQLGQRIINPNLERGVVPAWACMLTSGIDRQQDKFVWVLDAWGPGRRNATIAYGEHRDLDQIVQEILLPTYRHVDEGEPVKCCMALVDSGYRALGVYESCVDALKCGVQVFPCKGSRNTLEADFRITKLGKDTAMPGMPLIWVDTGRTQGWIDTILHTLDPGDPGSTELHQGSLESHQFFLQQLINDGPTYKLDSTNNERENWERIDPRMPNDYRDCRRYSYAAMVLATGNRPIPERQPAPPVRKKTAGAQQQPLRRWS